MNRPAVRRAKSAELDAVFMMGFDAWSDGKPPDEYLLECRSSPKYREGRWHVLASGKRLLSSLILHEFPRNALGLGSIATPPELRGRGHASELISGVLAGIDARDPGAVIFIFSDIAPKFYERFGFVALPKRYQKRPGSICMVRSADIKLLLKDPKFIPPQYF